MRSPLSLLYLNENMSNLFNLSSYSKMRPDKRAIEFGYYLCTFVNNIPVDYTEHSNSFLSSFNDLLWCW